MNDIEKIAMEEVRAVMSRLTCTCNINLLHPLDKERILKELWGLARKKLLNTCDIAELARTDFHWNAHSTSFLESAVDIVEILYPLAMRGELTTG